MTKFSEKLKRGETPGAEDWEEHLRVVHAEAPSMSPNAFAGMRTLFGKNSYTLLAETVEKNADASVLDLACGDGHLASYLLERVGTYTGVDMSEGELAVARKTAAGPRAKFVQARAQQLPFADREFDSVVCHMALMLMNPLDPVVREIHRVLKPGGRFSAVIGAPPDDDFLREVARLSMIYVTERFPGYAEALRGDRRVANLAGLRELFSPERGFEPPERIEDIHLEVHTDPEGIWNLKRNVYYVGLLGPADKEELRSLLVNFARKHARFGRHLHFEFPMRMFSVRRTDG